MKINIITLGCSKNTVDSENLAGHLAAAGHTVHFDRQRNDCDTIIVNTCGFIDRAKEESINSLLAQVAVKTRGRKARRLIAVGCLVERYREDLQREMPEVDAWFGAHQWQEVVAYVGAESGEWRVENGEWRVENGERRVENGERRVESGERRTESGERRVESGEGEPMDGGATRALSTPKHYAYLKIAEGCNRSCSYCAIPLIRGAHKSRPIEELVAEAKALVASGVKELIVISQDTTYYGLDLYRRRALGDLLDRLATESGAPWIRLHYTYPTSFPLDAIEAIRRHANICNYIDIPLQHINTRILGSMRRGIDRQGTLDLIGRFRSQIPDVAIRTTLIVGYPGETEAEFEELKAFVREARFDRMGCFAYSPEEGTAAYALGDPVAQEEKERRVAELMALQEGISLEKNRARVGNTYRCLVDRHEGDYLIARTEYDSPEVDDEVIIRRPKGRGPKAGDFVEVRITAAMENDLTGELI